MKKITSYLVFSIILLAAACKPETATESKNPNNAQKEVVDILDQFHNSVRNRKAAEITNFLTEDGLFCGTDPKDVYNKTNFSDYIRLTLADSTKGNLSYIVDIREIRFDKSGNSAIAVEQFKMNAYTPKIPWRLVSHFVKEDDTWKINFLSFNVIPNNAQMGTIIKALE